ncbi:hypothetical protein A0H81_09376 [Grifola frondosa]|uniref:Protein kinase domain-containing protein n=1 Tax=Grifola frondosa TaxID=5627 RepID=A0A1C7M1N7_GRIFR|nr:hypothetical protein A0H81_09376 [Grifola frondosa]
MRSDLDTLSKDVVSPIPASSDTQDFVDPVESRARIPPGHLRTSELYWRDRQKWLEERGYMLRPRYMPDWKPSWEGTKKHYHECEDGLRSRHTFIVDATRMSDGTVVTLKNVSKSLHPHEADIGLYFSAEQLASDAHNHCVPIYEILHDPNDEDLVLLVMPLLRSFDEPPFDTVGEAVDFFRQCLEGMQLMHHHHVAHRDCMELNIMMDPAPMYPRSFHPSAETMKPDLTGKAKHYSRTERPTKYYYIDFGLSRKYDPENRSPVELPIEGGDKTVPEFQNEGYDKPWNPFRTDIYYIGNLIRTSFLQRYKGLEFMYALINDMVQADPEKRPTIDEVMTRFEGIYQSLSYWKLRSRLAKRHEFTVVRLVRAIAHAFRTTGYIVRRLPPLPNRPQS